MPKHNPPWLPAEYKDSDAHAIQMMSRGEANEGQQIQALNWIIEHCCKTHDMSYRPESTQDTAFAEGKRFVGNQIIKMVKLKLGKLEAR